MPDTKTYEFQPVGLDIYDKRANHPAPGTLVRKVSLPGCPPSGTMGHTHIEEVETGRFAGLVLLNSLRPA